MPAHHRPIRTILLFAIGVPLTPPYVMADDRIPGTLNFVDATAIHIPVFEVESLPPNEKIIALGDFDDDGDLDVAIASAYGDFGAKKNKCYRNDAGVLVPGSDAHIPTFNTNRTTRAVFFGHANNDAFLDLIEINAGNNGGTAGDTRVYLGSGPPDFTLIAQAPSASFAFAPGNSLGGFQPWRHPANDAECGDFDLDGYDDIWFGNTPNQSQDAIALANGNAAGTFLVYGAGAAGLVPTDISYTCDVSAADLNNDGAVDVIQADGLVQPPGGRVYWNSTASPGNFKVVPASALTNDNSPFGSRYAGQPADLNNDGWTDVVWVNRGPDNAANRLAAFVNNGPDGLDALGRATFTEAPLAGGIPSVNSVEGKKVTLSDLNADGWMDLLLQSDHDDDDGANTGVSGLRVLRNVTPAPGATPKFIDWSPDAIVRDGSSTSRGWQAKAFDLAVDGDEYLDILNGLWVNEKVYRNVPAQELTEPLDGALQLAARLYGQTIAIRGQGAVGTVDQHTLPEVPAGATISAVLQGGGDYTLTVRNPSNAIVFSSNAGLVGQQEAGQANVGAAAGPWAVEASLSSPGAAAFTVVGSACDPPDGYIDPRQDRATSNGPAQGLSNFLATFAQPVNLTVGDVGVFTANGAALSVATLSGTGGVWTVTLSAPIPPGAWTRFSFGTGSANSLTYGFLPGDVDANGLVAVGDILSLVVAINGGSAIAARHDLNRDGVVSAADILRGVQLLNGVGTSQVWLGAALPAAPPLADVYVLEVLVRTLP